MTLSFQNSDVDRVEQPITADHIGFQSAQGITATTVSWALDELKQDHAAFVTKAADNQVVKLTGDQSHYLIGSTWLMNI